LHFRVVLQACSQRFLVRSFVDAACFTVCRCAHWRRLGVVCSPPHTLLPGALATTVSPLRLGDVVVVPGEVVVVAVVVVV
jgi:hypothetical protein